MSADRDLFNRRELRQSLGTRTSRRSSTKTANKRRRKSRPKEKLGRLVMEKRQEAENGILDG